MIFKRLCFKYRDEYRGFLKGIGDQMKILVVAAHPDDEVLGVGGTIAKHVQEGDEVFVCVFSEGRAEPVSLQEKGELKQNALDSSKLLGVKKTVFLRLPDQKFDSLPILHIIQKLEDFVNEVKPDIVYTHNESDLNRDHRVAFEASMVAARPHGGTVKKILSYEVPSSTELASPESRKIFSPNLYINIEKTLDKKLEAMKIYGSEFRPFPHPRSIEALKAWAVTRGVEAGLPAAECFMIIREIKD